MSPECFLGMWFKGLVICFNFLEESKISFLGIWRKEGYHETPRSRFIPFGFVFQEFRFESFILDEFLTPPIPHPFPRAGGAIGNFK